MSSDVDRRAVVLVYGIVVVLLLAAWWYRPAYWIERLDTATLVPRYRAGDPQHLNPEGAALKAKLFADFIEESGLMREKIAALASVESR